jgi:predicted dehydrogenase
MTIGNGKVRFALVGCGNIGARHAAVVDAEERAVLAALCDVESARAEKLSTQYGGTPVFRDYEEMLEKVPCDVVSICTPHGLHAPMAIRASERGRNVLVEKPMALTVRDSQAMIDAAQRAGVKLMVVKQNRYNVPIALTKKAIEDKRLGRIFMTECNVLWNRHDEYYANSNWHGRKSLEGGALYTQASHFIDLLIWWFGDVIAAESWIATRNHSIEIEDCGHALLEFDSGVTGSLDWTTCVYNKNFEGSITIIGEHGIIKIGGQYLNKIDYWDVKSYPLSENVQFVDKPNNYGKYQGTSSNHDKVVHGVVAALLSERHHVVEGNEGMKSIEAIELIYNVARRK